MVELQAVLDAARSLAPEELPRLLGDLETVRAIAWSRLSMPAPPTPQKPRDELLDVKAAAAKLRLSPSYLYHNHKKFPFSRRIGRSLSFSALGIDAFIDSGALTPRRRRLMVTPVVEDKPK